MRLASLRNTLAILAVATVTAAPGLFAQTHDEQDFQQTVARVAWMSGDVSLQRGDDPDAWQPLGVNVPLTLGDRVYASPSGRLEVEAPGLRAFVAPGTDFATLNLTEDVQQYSISLGTATFRVSRRDDEDVIEVDTPNAAITLEATGLYRVSVDEDGNTRVLVRRGEASVASGGGEVTLRAGEEMHVDGLDTPEYDVFALAASDSWDRWVDSREKRRHAVAAYDYTSEDILGASDLDSFGQWQVIPEYGRVWSPANVGSDWAPYRLGRWIWQDPWGWTWVSDEPWGWAPYHYGRWVTRASRWYWVPVAPNVRHVNYAPALVAFVGGGPGWSATASIGGGGFVGWFPLGPRDLLVPWWGRQTRAPIRPANAFYANRAHVTVVNRGVFTSAQPAQGGRIRDTNILQEMGRQPILRGPLPVLPTAQSIRPAFRPGAGPRPPERIVARAVAARLAPPPAPPAFSVKIDVIRGNRGAPMSPAAAINLARQSNAGARPAVPIRPVLRDRVELAPRRDAVDAPPPDPIRPGRRAYAPYVPAAPAAPKTMPPFRERMMQDESRPAPAAPQVPRAMQPARERMMQDESRPAAAPPAVHVQPQAPPHAQPRVQAPSQPQAPPQAQAPPQPQAQQQPQAERRPVSRASRRVAPPGRDPLQASPPEKDDKDDKADKRDKDEKEKDKAEKENDKADKDDDKREKEKKDKPEKGQGRR